jgi:hypothetical protein
MYSTGLLVLSAPVMHVERLYQLPGHAYAVLLAKLYHCPGFGNFCRAVMAAYKAMLQQSTIVGTGTHAQQPLERLRKIARKGSCAALYCTGEACIKTLQLLRQ